MRQGILILWFGVVSIASGMLLPQTLRSTPIAIAGADSDIPAAVNHLVTPTQSSQVDIESCVATWTGLTNNAPVVPAVPVSTKWNFATGAPPAKSFSISPDDCAYDTSEPSNTPLELPPAGTLEPCDTPPKLPPADLPWRARIIDDAGTCTERFVANIDFRNGVITFLNGVDAGSDVDIVFYFQPPAPEPVPVPSMSSVSLAILAGLFVIVITWRLNRRRLSKRN